MRKQLFKIHLLSWAALCGIAIAFASCSNEDVLQNTADTDNNDKNLTTFVTGGPETTRTTMDYTTGNFFWEAGDKIYVKDDDGNWQVSSNAPTAKTAYFKFKVPGKFNNHTSYRVYYPGKGGSNNQVTIPATQSQSEPNSTARFGISGDCGTAMANKITGKHKFEFALEHQAAILVFEPFTTNDVLKTCYLTKIEVSSDNDIASTYTLSPSTGEITGTGTDKQIILTTKGSGAYADGFPLTNATSTTTADKIYMLIKPGTHKLKIRYWLKDLVSGIEGTITKAPGSFAYVKNNYYDMKADLDIRVYSGNDYYLWDAQQNYWYGHEWDSADPWQPTLKTQPANPNYPKTNSDPRWYNEGFNAYGNRFDATHASCKDLPNINEMAWYAKMGDPHWDDDELWTTMGHLYKGGMWLLKHDKISGYSKEYAYDGIDWRTIHKTVINNDIKHSSPSAGDANKFFYLPASGYYDKGKLCDIGWSCFYRSSSAFTLGGYNGQSFILSFFINGTYAGDHDRNYGFRAQKFE